MLSFNITDSDHCRSIESYLRMLMPLAACSYIRKLIKNGSARLNGITVTPDTILNLHNIVSLKESNATTGFLSSKRSELDILFEDTRIAVVNKPAGLPMHRTAEHEDNLVDFAQRQMALRGTPCKLYPVNRLDRGTSGVVILAKSSNSAGLYGRQVKDEGLDKLYLAVVSGLVHADGTCSEPLDGKESLTNYSVLLHGTACTLLAVRPVSGRMHQIRRHMEMLNHPIIGDKRYGGGECQELAGFALHSFSTLFDIEGVGDFIITAPLPDEIIVFCEQRGIKRDSLLKKLYWLAKDRQEQLFGQLEKVTT